MSAEIRRSLWQNLLRPYLAYRANTYVEKARTFMTLGEFESALEELRKAQQCDIGFSPRALLLLSFCLYSLKHFELTLVAVEEFERSLSSNSGRNSLNELRYLKAFSGIIRNACINTLGAADLPLQKISLDKIDLRDVSDDILATFPLVDHRDWKKYGWSP